MSFIRILEEQYGLYPKMQPQDFIKLAYQNEFGGGHFIENAESSLELLEKEVLSISHSNRRPLLEDIGNGSFRIYLDSYQLENLQLSTINQIFVQSSQLFQGSRTSFLSKLEEVRDFCNHHPLDFSVGELDEYLEEYSSLDYPAVHHSDTYRREYHPHYRIIHGHYQRFMQIFYEIDQQLRKKDVVKVAIDGMSASGKTTLSHMLQRIYDCHIFHMDDFFLPLKLKTPERLKEVGGNVDYERFHQEVLSNINGKSKFSYNIYSCKTNTYTKSNEIKPKRLYVIEGAYSMHPTLIGHYDLKIFLSIHPEKQRERILKRNGEAVLDRFIEEWIPKENIYAEKMKIKEKSDLIYNVE